MNRSRPPSVFAQRVLRVLQRIPAGRVATYGDVAALAGRPGAARAVGTVMALARRPGLPYHRVVAAGGRVGGYGGHPQLKADLLRAEGLIVAGKRIKNFSTCRVPVPGRRSSQKTMRKMTKRTATRGAGGTV